MVTHTQESIAGARPLSAGVMLLRLTVIGVALLIVASFGPTTATAVAAKAK
jgi:hypothetical protein